MNNLGQSGKITCLVRPTLMSAYHHSGTSWHVQWKLIRPLPESDPDSSFLLTEEVLGSEREQYRLFVFLWMEYYVTSFVYVLKLKYVFYEDGKVQE